MTYECTTPVIIACVELDLGFGIAAQRDPQAGEGVDGWLAVAEAITLRA